MTRTPRLCSVGSCHHVFNRGIARRAIFDGDVDRRFFLSLLAKEVAAGRILLHAYSLLDNHFHLLIEAPTGDLGIAMREICRAYVKTFNRAHDRDGPLFRSRFSSKLLDNERYLRATLSYIDDNPVDAGLSPTPHEYPFGSAYHFYHGDWPHWLTSEWVQGVVKDWTGIDGLPPGLYGSSGRHGLRPDLRDLIAVRMQSRSTRDGLPQIITPSFAVGWLRERAEAADGVGPWLPLAAATCVRRVCAEERASEPDWTQLASQRRRPLWAILETGLLHRVACCKVVDISHRLGVSESTVANRIRTHDRLVLTDASYRQRAAEVTYRVLHETHG